MAKRKSFRETWDDDECGDNDDYSSKKENRKKQRREKRKSKLSERWLEDDFNLSKKNNK